MGGGASKEEIDKVESGALLRVDRYASLAEKAVSDDWETKEDHKLRLMLRNPTGIKYLSQYAFRASIENPWDEKGEGCDPMQKYMAIQAWLAIAEYRSIYTAQHRMYQAQHIRRTYQCLVGTIIAKEEWDSHLDPMDEGSLANPKYCEVDAVGEHALDTLQDTIFNWMLTDMLPAFKKSEEFEEYRNMVKGECIRIRPDDFIIGKVLGGGGFGVVCSGEKISTGKQYALKIQSKVALLKDHMSDPSRIIMERKIYTHLHFPFIVSLQYAFQTPSLVFIVMDLVQGGDLQHHLYHSGGFFSEERTRFYIAETILGLQHLHSVGILYRDLKPANILLDRDGHIQLADMGVAAEFSADFWNREKKKHGGSFVYHGDCAHDDDDDGDDDPLCEVANPLQLPVVDEGKAAIDDGMAPFLRQRADRALIRKTMIGTPMYQAPEMLSAFESCHAYGPSIDIWALGVMMFHFMSSAYPYDMEAGAFPPKIRESALHVARIKTPHVSEACLDVLARLLKFQVSERIVSGPRGWKELMEHDFFRPKIHHGEDGQIHMEGGVDWSKLIKKDISPPFVPKKRRDWDLRHQVVDTLTHHKAGGHHKAAENIDEIIKSYVKKEKGDYTEWTKVPADQGQRFFEDWDVVSQPTLLEEMEASNNRAAEPVAELGQESSGTGGRGGGIRMSFVTKVVTEMMEAM